MTFKKFHYTMIELIIQNTVVQNMGLFYYYRIIKTVSAFYYNDLHKLRLDFTKEI